MATIGFLIFNPVTARQAQNICMTFVQCWPSVEDCVTVNLCWFDNSIDL